MAAKSASVWPALLTQRTPSEAERTPSLHLNPRKRRGGSNSSSSASEAEVDGESESESESDGEGLADDEAAGVEARRQWQWQADGSLLERSVSAALWDDPAASPQASDSSSEADEFDGQSRSSDASDEGSVLSSSSSDSEDYGGWSSASPSSSTGESGRQRALRRVRAAEEQRLQLRRALQRLGSSSSTATRAATACSDSIFAEMARTDNVGFVAWLVPLTGISTMLGTEALACIYHFTCSENFPTLSYAATFNPERQAFAAGMTLTAIFIFASVALFFWYCRLRMKPKRQQDTMEEDDSDTSSNPQTQLQMQKQRRNQTLVCYACLLSGVAAASSLFGLAILDMRSHHDAHITFTIVFFVAAWVTMIAVQVARKSVLGEDSDAGNAGLLAAVSRRSFWTSLRRWRRLDFSTAYTLGRLLLTTGLASTFLFGLFFLCANGVWPNPLGFTAVQEAFFEASAIVCQLLFMGTLSCELARLARLVEQRDYMELERAE